MTLDWLSEPGAAWLAAALLLGLAELAVPGVFLVFLALAAAATAAISYAIAPLPLAAQLVCFALWSAVAVVVGRRWYRDYPVAGGDSHLNDRAARLVGEVTRLERAIVDGRGRVAVGDGSWPARGPDLPAGARVRIVAVRDGVVSVEAV
ncbi:NfeD family protein [Sphingomonas sp. RHCKR7]|uniref:NfeD family protein n=1 Tax=Sphingomonas folli TaxID=2862497 RepID=UPI001CA4F7D4|nr:NfeD family protein [Sphingomonas folli]MBW6525796.1 NfeD family protein [Sphingomonas folli]